jgi:hypothetical protein
MLSTCEVVRRGPRLSTSAALGNTTILPKLVMISTPTSAIIAVNRDRIVSSQLGIVQLYLIVLSD